MGEVRSPAYQQSEAIASLREALANHQPIARRERHRKRRHKREQRRRQEFQASDLNQAAKALILLPRWIWTPLVLLGLMLTGGVGLVALQWLLQPPPPTNCRALSPLAAPAKRLHCAQQLAAAGNPNHLVASIGIIQNWGPEHPLYQEAQGMLADWSATLLERAEDMRDVSGLDPAVALVRQIPTSSPHYSTAQQAIEDWQQQWAEGDRIYQAALAALEQQDWKLSSQQVGALGQLSSPYWNRTRADTLSLRIVDEQQGQQRLVEAQEMAADTSPAQVAMALMHLETITPQTLAWQKAQPLRQQWSRRVTEAAVAELDAGHVDRAVDLAQALPVTLLSSASSDLPAKAIDLIRYSRVQRLAAGTTAQPANWWQLTEAIAAAQALSPQSEFGQRIQPQLIQWQEQRDTMAQLQLAQAMAGTGQRQLLAFSIAQTDRVSDQSLQRPQAELLISRWRQALTQIEGRPQFMLAQQIAQPGTIEALNAAIRLTEPLIASGTEWPQVQQAIADWRSQVQTIEDRPTVAQAQTYAAKGEFWKAIAEIETIAEGRALHAQAQSLVAEWRGTLQAAEDRNRLEEAKQLAAGQRLSRAITVAAAIAPTSDLYGDAQSVIAQWEQARDAIWVSQQRRAESLRDSEPDVSVAATSPAPAPIPSAPNDAESDESPYYGYYGTDE
ncbi:MAG: hypothetical protein WBA10_15900 [Elainellaceae cyanobacterium]